MAFFTDNRWKDKDKILEDRINGSKGYMLLTLEESDYNSENWGHVYNLNSGVTGLTAIDLLHLVVVEEYPVDEGDTSSPLSNTMSITEVKAYPGNGTVPPYFSLNNNRVYYTPATGYFSDHEPQFTE